MPIPNAAVWRQRTTVIVALLAVISGMFAAGPLTGRDGGANPFAVSAAEAATAEVWIGSPGAYNWPTKDGCSGATYPSAACSWPTVHHTFKYPGDAWVGDVGFDFGGASDAESVLLYAAPQNTANNTKTTAHVVGVSPACAKATTSETDAARVKRGGYAVVVEIRVSGTVIGTVDYVHIQPSVKKGDTINRWGSKVGTIGTYTKGKCWTGRHLHLEMTNQSGYACFNKSFAANASMKASNFMGFIGGSRVSKRGTACP